MNSKKLTVTIGIPAHNEEKNIKYLLESILEQNKEGYDLENILIISDGSTDNTVRFVKKLQNNTITIINGKKRLGKAIRFNYLLKRNASDIFIQLDGDVVLKNKDTIKKIIKPFFKDPNIAVVNGSVEPVVPITLVERLSHFGFEIWQESKRILGKKAERYRSIGQIRAFSKEFTKHFHLPRGTDHFEDIYVFYYAISNGWKIVSVSDAIVLYRLSSSFNDYINQMVRHLQPHSQLEKHFDKEILEKYETISMKLKLQVLMRLAQKTRLDIVIFFCLLQGITYCFSAFTKVDNIWNISKTTKRGIEKSKSLNTSHGILAYIYSNFENLKNY